MNNRADYADMAHRAAARAFRSGLALGVFLLAAGVCLADEDSGYINEDVVITGKTVRTQDIGGQKVVAVLGGMNVKIGPRTITSDEGVIWMQNKQDTVVAERDMCIYAQSNAKIAEPGNVTASDRKMVIPVRVKGKVLLIGDMVEGPVAGLGVYEAGIVARKVAAMGGGRARQPASPEAENAEVPAGERASVKPGGNDLVVLPGEAENGDAESAEQAPIAQEPTDAAVPGAPRVKSSTKAKRTSTGPASTQPRSARAVKRGYSRIHLQAEGPIDSRIEKDPLGEMRRVTTAQKNVILTAYDPNGQAMELTCQNAVIFTKKLPPKSASIPWSPQMGGMTSDLPGPKEYKESLQGVYLMGDVTIRRGDRVIRAPEAYYEFAKDRAVIPHAVFQAVVPGRDVPIVVRADQMRELSSTEVWFKNAQISTSEFATPEYAINPRVLYMKETTAYDATGQKVSERGWYSWMQDLTFRVRDVPVFYMPRASGAVEENNIPLTGLKFGSFGDLGWGVESQWDLYRLLGMVAPQGWSARLDADAFTHGAVLGVGYDYLRDTYSGYGRGYFVHDGRGEDDFGRDRKNIPAPSERGRLLMRDKHILADDWEVQLELSYLSDRNFLESFFRDEYEAGKDQETLAYFKKQGGDNWAVTGLLQYRLNDFQTQTESYPDLAFWMAGQPLGDSGLVYFNESQAGVKRYASDKDSSVDSSGAFARGHTRQEIDAPFRAGPVNFRPFAMVDAAGWGDSPDGSSQSRVIGQLGMQSSMDIWRTYNNVNSRLWDVNGLRHIITPVASAWVTGSSGADPSQLYALDPGIEQDVTKAGGVAFGAFQRLQTQRGPAGKRSTVDWMRLDTVVGLFDSQAEKGLPQDGIFIFHRPEFSLPRDYFALDYSWQVSDSVLFQAGSKFDLDGGNLSQSYVGLAIDRDPRMRYFLGWRYINEVNSSVFTFGANYKISDKYSVSFFEQYDTKYDGGRNLATSVSLVRKFPRWYTAFTLQYDTRNDNVSLYVSFWPEGVPEVRFTSRNSSLLGHSSEN
ncbi:MAG: LPS assembly protein LptD [Planctomycetota bacterium]|nr:LPS assembly protein LptD [Planctomycetota bacterium]